MFFKVFFFVLRYRSTTLLFNAFVVMITVWTNILLYSYYTVTSGITYLYTAKSLSLPSAKLEELGGLGQQ